MPVCVEKLPHSCGADRALQVFENEDGGYSGYCFSCNTYVADPYHDKPVNYKPKFKRRSSAEIQEEIDSIKEYPTVDLPERELLEKYLDYFDIKIGVSEQDGVTPTLHYYPYCKDREVTSYKVRLVEGKRIWSMGDQKEVDLFGWNQAVESGAKRLFITEGELDAVSLFQVMKEDNKNNEKYKAFNPAVCSLPHGAGSAGRDIARLLPKINKQFKEVVLVFDMDEAGRKAAEEVCKVLPNALVAELPEKDANECLIKGKKKALIASVMFRASKKKNTRLVWGGDLHEAARKEAPWGVSWPWKKITELTRGIRKGETIYLGAAQKMG